MSKNCTHSITVSLQPFKQMRGASISLGKISYDTGQSAALQPAAAVMILLLRTAQLKVLVFFDRPGIPKIVRYCGGSRHRLVIGSLGPKVHNRNGILIGSSVFAGLAVVTNRQTDIQTYKSRHSACRNRLSNKQRFCQNYRNQLILAQVAAENNV